MTIEIRNLSFSYGETRVLKDINFKASAGQLIAVLGSNGAGKSTLFRCILKFLKGYEGDILLKGRNTKEMSSVEIARNIAYIPQNADPVFNYTVHDMVLMGTTSGINLLQMPKKEQIQVVDEALEMLDISHLAHRGIGRISGGERQLAMIARAIVQEAEIIIMDEPTANLDYGNQMKVMRMIKRLAHKGYTIIMSTHNPDQALLFADTAFILKNGGVIDAGDVERVMTDEIMEELYNVKVKICEHNIYGEHVRTCIPVDDMIQNDYE